MSQDSTSSDNPWAIPAPTPQSSGAPEGYAPTVGQPATSPSYPAAPPMSQSSGAQVAPPAYQYGPGVPAQAGAPVVAFTQLANYGVEPRTGLPYSDKSKVVAGLLQIFLGGLGIGRFYMGNVGIAIAQIAVTWLTFGFGVIWPVIDGIFILAGSPRDRDGRPLRP